MNKVDNQYLALGKKILEEGEVREDRTGVGTISLWNQHLEFDLREGFPLLTTKKIQIKAVIDELLWFLSGSTNINNLNSKFIWEPWADENGEVGKIYGYQWVSQEHYTGEDCYGRVSYQEVNQIAKLIRDLKGDPFSRRHLVSAWNVFDLNKMCLPPCHYAFQCHVSADKQYLDLLFQMRSNDLPIGLPYNIASYAILLMMLAKETGYTPRYLGVNLGDVHIYLNQIEQFNKQLQREPRDLPILKIVDKPFWQLVEENTAENFILENYNPHPFIKYEVAV